MEGKKTLTMTKIERGNVDVILVSAHLGPRQIVDHPREAATTNMDHDEDRRRQDPTTSGPWSALFFPRKTPFPFEQTCHVVALGRGPDVAISHSFLTSTPVSGQRSPRAQPPTRGEKQAPELLQER